MATNTPHEHVVIFDRLNMYVGVCRHHHQVGTLYTIDQSSPSLFLFRLLLRPYEVTDSSLSYHPLDSISLIKNNSVDEISRDIAERGWMARDPSHNLKMK